MAAILLMAALFVVGAVIDLSRAAGNGTVKRVVEIRQGTTLRRLALELEEAGVINSALLMTYYGRLTGNASRLQAGTYQFSNNMSPRVILGKLVAGEVMTITFTVPEGYNIYQVAELLERQGLFKRQPFLERCADRKLLRSLGIRAATVEGYLYPSTYQLTMDMDESDLIRLMVRTFFQEYSDDFARQAK
ncbi:MAG TPA: endolytic transglycosylase MltG, partial [Geobacterales bacterium]|nr:endolytic transglycosylase MltG [Geobacterales bacterium]